jgi:hypothetical protein
VPRHRLCHSHRCAAAGGRPERPVSRAWQCARTPWAKQIACFCGLPADGFVICAALVAIDHPLRVPGPTGATGQWQRYLWTRCEAEGCDTGRGVTLQCPRMIPTSCHKRALPCIPYPCQSVSSPDELQRKHGPPILTSTCGRPYRDLGLVLASSAAIMAGRAVDNVGKRPLFACCALRWLRLVRHPYQQPPIQLAKRMSCRAGLIRRGAPGDRDRESRETTEAVSGVSPLVGERRDLISISHSPGLRCVLRAASWRWWSQTGIFSLDGCIPPPRLGECCVRSAH